MPPSPMHQSVRARANVRSTRATLYEIPDDEVEIPVLPKRYDAEGNEVPWRLETLAWWEDIWSSPMSSEFHPSDTHGLFRLAVLVDNYWRAPSVSLSSEIRLLQQSYGLTPLDRRRLEWTIESAESAKSGGDKRRERERVERLGAVQPTADGDPRLKALA